MSDQSVGKKWSRVPLIKNRFLRRALYTGIVLYLIFALGAVEINWLRVYQGMGRAGAFLGGFLQPDFLSRGPDIVVGVVESLGMALAATVVGVILGIPVSFGAARNISILPVYLLCRAFVVVSRAFHEIVVAILFVAMVGFGPLAGALTLTFNGIGFIGKLLGEDIEDIQSEQLEAIRATGGTWFQQMLYGVVPQVMPRLVGLSLYRFDINFRVSSVIGIVGAGGIGATINTALQRYEYDVAGAIILTIVVIVLVVEAVSGMIRKGVQ